MQQDSIKERLKKEMQQKMNLFFKLILSSIEVEPKRFGVKSEFYTTEGEGFKKVRQVVLEVGNGFIRDFDSIIDNIEQIIPKGATINISPELWEKMQNDRDKCKGNKR